MPTEPLHFHPSTSNLLHKFNISAVSFIIPNFHRGTCWNHEIKEMVLVSHSDMTHMIAQYPLPSYYFRHTPRS